ncbi:hypothetical protein EB796_007595 [Bugula neritina]|uniref:Uncharacterized protein n=1 Tax=Bugula neritina TaxID=10212 RepID=A0A7J7K961_BUGNE|nr:hypothetical protein EB796_007595 [Bugula neritina]
MLLVTEGLFLKRNDISPYEGDVFHQTPLMLNFLDWIEGNYSQVLPGLFVVFDVLLAILIGRAAVETGRFMLLLQQKSKPHYHKNVDESLLLK